MDFVRLFPGDNAGIAEMSAMATEIVRQHFDPIIGTAQNDYMLSKFQTPESIKSQLENGYNYFFVRLGGENIGFLAFYPREGEMYLSKFYLYKSRRGQGYAHGMMDFVISAAKAAGLPRITLNVNRNNDAIFAYEKMGFYVLREEKNDIGCGFYMDDFVYCLDITD